MGSESISVPVRQSFRWTIITAPNRNFRWMKTDGQTSIFRRVIDHVQMIRDIDQLRSGQSIELDTYTYNRDVMKSEKVIIEPSEWLVVEGLFAMAYPEMKERVDVLGYIDAPVEVRLQRRIDRDGSDRGYAEDEVRYQWENHVRPADIAYIEPWKTPGGCCGQQPPSMGGWIAGID